jgi:hypothetical protein
MSRHSPGREKQSNAAAHVARTSVAYNYERPHQANADRKESETDLEYDDSGVVELEERQGRRVPYALNGNGDLESDVQEEDDGAVQSMIASAFFYSFHNIAGVHMSVVRIA